MEEKRRVKEEKKLAKQIKKKKKSSIKISDDSTENLLKDAEINLSEFSEIVEKITKKNTFKPYPDINDIPN